MPPYNFKTTLSKTVPLFAKVYSKVTFFLSAYWGGNHYPTLLQTFSFSILKTNLEHVILDVSIPESERVVGLKPGFNSKTIQTNTPPPLRPPGPPSPPPYGHTISQRLTTFALSLFLNFFYKYSPFKSEAVISRTKANILQGPRVLCADDAAILVLSVHASDGCG